MQQIGIKCFYGNGANHLCHEIGRPCRTAMLLLNAATSEPDRFKTSRQQDPMPESFCLGLSPERLRLPLITAFHGLRPFLSLRLACVRQV